MKRIGNIHPLGCFTQNIWNMRVVIQRVSFASVLINQSQKRNIGKGLLIFAGIEDADKGEDVDWLAAKITNLRIFNDPNGIMNCSVNDISGELLVISQFTLHASTRKGNRPSYIKASKPERAIPVYQSFLGKLQELTNRPVISGEFGAHMDVELLNDGPVTIVIDTKNKE
jgi:D-tyrosyl-tRNA(Tyr) deacylase